MLPELPVLLMMENYKRKVYLRVPVLEECVCFLPINILATGLGYMFILELRTLFKHQHTFM